MERNLCEQLEFPGFGGLANRHGIVVEMDEVYQATTRQRAGAVDIYIYVYPL